MRPRKHILLVEPAATVAETLQFLLETSAWPPVRVQRADCAACAARALAAGPSAAAAAPAAPPVPFDLVLANLRLHRDDEGAALARDVRLSHPDTRTLLYSHTTRSYERAGCADAFLPKGATPAELLKTARLLLARKRGPKKSAASVAAPHP